MREKKFGKRFLAWVLTMVLTVSLLPLSALAEDGEARFYGKNVTSTYARDNASVNEAEVQSGENGQGNDETGEVSEEEPAYAAKIGNVTYDTLQAAIRVADGTVPVVLAKNWTENVVIDKSLTLDLNGKTLTGDGMDSVVTITGENTIVTIMSSALNEDESVKNGNCASLAGGIYIVNDEDIINVGENYQLGTKVVNIPDKDSVISYATIESNTASSIGGGLYIGGQNELTISNSTISGNNGSAQGGGIVAYSPAELVLDNTDVFQNEAAAGAGLFAYATASGNTHITLKNKTAFMNNTADGFGGGLYIQKLSGNQPVVDVENSALYNNTAATAGDDLLLSGATYTLPVASQMPGDKKLASDGEDITGWYHDGWYKWNPTANDGKGSYEEIGRWTVDTADEYKPVANDSQAISLKAAHAQMFTVTYTDGVDNEEVFKDQVYKVAKGSATPGFDGDTPTRSGYTFMGWSPTVAETVTADVTYIAQWKRNGGHHPSKPDNTVEIPDEDALGLNTDDHFAYIIGYPDGTVQPNGQITRAEATTIFFRLLTEESRSANLTKTNGYTDVASDAWYNTAVSAMTKAGIVDGYPDGTFRPDAPITRAEMAKIISLFAKLDKSESRFSDIAGHWAEAYIKLAAGNGWIAGYPDGTFGPQRNITRAETATMINRVLDRVPSEESHLLSRGVMQIWPDANPGDWFYLAMQEATNSHDYERNAKWAAADEQWTALRETRDWKALEQ